MVAQKNYDIIPAGTFMAQLSDGQKGGIKQSIALGEDLQRHIPQIAQDYRAGLSLMDIVNKYNIQSAYNVGVSVANNAVYLALAGYDGRFNMFPKPQYPGLIPSADMQILGRNHNASTGSLIGKMLKQTGRGIFSISKAERERIGRASGLAQYAKGLGIHSQTREEKRESGRLGITAKGKIPWSDEEIRYVIQLSTNPDYRRKTRIHAQRIYRGVNETHHQGKEVRSPRDITKLLSDVKRGTRI